MAVFSQRRYRLSYREAVERQSPGSPRSGAPWEMIDNRPFYAEGVTPNAKCYFNVVAPQLCETPLRCYAIVAVVYPGCAGVPRPWALALNAFGVLGIDDDLNAGSLSRNSS